MERNRKCMPTHFLIRLTNSFFRYSLERIEKLNDSGWIRTNVTRLRNEYLKPLDYRAKIYICFIFTSNQM